ncbi:hypothetical protein ACEPAF_1235 [Sanghuangporus sanghuang]
MFPSIPRAIRLTGKIPPPYQAVEAVLSILRDSPNGASTKEIFQRATPKSIPRNPTESASEHPFQSMRYLKKTILATLQEKGVIEKFHVQKDPSEVELEVAPSLKGKKPKKKQNPNIPKLAWYWRIHEWERSVAQSKQTHDVRMERKSTMEANTEAQTPAKATA